MIFLNIPKPVTFSCHFSYSLTRFPFSTENHLRQVSSLTLDKLRGMFLLCQSSMRILNFLIFHPLLSSSIMPLCIKYQDWMFIVQCGTTNPSLQLCHYLQTLSKYWLNSESTFVIHKCCSSTMYQIWVQSTRQLVLVFGSKKMNRFGFWIQFARPVWLVFGFVKIHGFQPKVI